MIFLLSSLVSAIVHLCGIADISELPEDEFLRLSRLSEHPLPLNLASRPVLERTALLSDYQIASLMDYRSRNGAILSERELSLVDGFNAATAECLMCFFTLDMPSSGVPMNVSSPGTSWRSDALITGGMKISEGGIQASVMGRGEVSHSTRLGDVSASIAYRYGNDVGWSIGYASPGLLSKFTLSRLVLGCFNARFGQGLAHWSGISIDSYTTPSALMKRSTGLSSYSGWSPQYAMYGVAATMDVASFSLSPFADIRGGLYGLNVSWRHKSGELSLGASYDVRAATVMEALTLSADFRQSFRGYVFYGELAMKEAMLSACGGLRTHAGPVDCGLRMNVSWSSYALSSAFEWISMQSSWPSHSVNGGVCAEFHQQSHGHTPRGALSLKSSAVYTFKPFEALSLSTTAIFKYKALTALSDPDAAYASSWPLNRLDLRESVKWERDTYSISLRADAVLCDMKAGALGCLDGSCRYRFLSAHVQAAFFILDGWDSRVYVYRYDNPGNFSIPALYGRGYCLNCRLSAKVCKWIALHLSCSYCSYPWDRTGRPDALEGKFSLSFSL